MTLLKVQAAWRKAPPELRAPLIELGRRVNARELARRVGYVKLSRFLSDARALVSELTREEAREAVAGLVLRKARVYLVELTLQEAGAVADFLLNSEE